LPFLNYVCRDMSQRKVCTHPVCTQNSLQQQLNSAHTNSEWHPCCSENITKLTSGQLPACRQRRDGVKLLATQSTVRSWQQLQAPHVPRPPTAASTHREEGEVHDNETQVQIHTCSTMHMRLGKSSMFCVHVMQ
jgi:hypothetical protein